MNWEGTEIKIGCLLSEAHSLMGEAGAEEDKHRADWFRSRWGWKQVCILGTLKPGQRHVCLSSGPATDWLWNSGPVTYLPESRFCCLYNGITLGFLEDWIECLAQCPTPSRCLLDSSSYLCTQRADVSWVPAMYLVLAWEFSGEEKPDAVPIHRDLRVLITAECKSYTDQHWRGEWSPRGPVKRVLPRRWRGKHRCRVFRGKWQGWMSSWVLEEKQCQR